MITPSPVNEDRRLHALRSYRILDSLPEESFDALVSTTATLLGVPIALLSFVADDREWCKATVGLDLYEMPREWSFCAHAILQPNRVTVVPDAKIDPRFAENPMVLGPPYVRFYAGAPLVTPQGDVLGTLCILSPEPLSLHPEEEPLLQALARHAMVQLELRKKEEELERSFLEREWMEEALEIERSTLKAVVEGSPDAMYVKDREGRYRLINAAGANAVGLSSEKILLTS